MIDKRILRVCAAALLAAGCGSLPRHGSSALTSGGPRPQWADGDSAEYPRASYVTGVGVALDGGLSPVI